MPWSMNQVDIVNFFNNPWVLGIGGSVIAGLILYNFFGIGKAKKGGSTNNLSSIIAGGNVTAGRDIVIGSKSNNRIKTNAKYIYKKKTLMVTDSDPKNLRLSIEVTSFKKISSKISLRNAENIKWRAGYRFVNKLDRKRAYIFHVYQDPESNSFNSRIVEIEPDGKALSPDISETQIAIEDTKNFELVIENKNGKLHFYVDGIQLGEYGVPLQEISDLYIRGWSHGNDIPIAIVVELVKVWF